MPPGRIGEGVASSAVSTASVPMLAFTMEMGRSSMFVALISKRAMRQRLPLSVPISQLHPNGDATTLTVSRDTRTG